MIIKLVIFDADKTLWSHPNISALTFPFKLLDRNTISDARKQTCHLFEGIRELLSELQQKGILIALASWNKPEPVEKALQLFAIAKFFSIIKAESHPNKHLLIKEMLSDLSRKGVELRTEEILYVDDRKLHLTKTLSEVGQLHFLQMWVDTKNPNDILKYINGVQ